MLTGSTPARCIVAGLAMSFACVGWSQSSGSSASAGAGTSASASSSISSGASPLGSAVDASIQDGSYLASPISSLSGASVSGRVSDTPATAGGSGGHGSGASSGFGGAGAFNPSSAGWANSSSMGGPQKSETHGFDSGLPTAGMMKAARAAGSGTSGQSGRGAIVAQHPAIASGAAGTKAGVMSASSIAPGQHPSEGAGPKSSQESQGSEDAGTSGGSESGADGSYSMGFPDSTKGEALLSPPDAGTASVFSFAPSVSEEFPDLADREFLRPTFRVGPGESGGNGQKEDLYQRIESRLRKYREADEGPKNGLKKKKTKPKPFENPFATKPFGDEDSYSK